MVGHFVQKIKNAQTKKDTFENVLLSSRRNTNLIEIDPRKEVHNILFQNFLNNNNIKHYSTKTDKGAAFAKRLNRSIRDLLKRPVFEKVESNWIDLTPTILKQYKKRLHSSTKLTPIQGNLLKNEGQKIIR